MTDTKLPQTRGRAFAYANTESQTYISSAGQPRSGRLLWAFVTRTRPSVSLYLSVCLCVNLAASLSVSARRGSARPHGPSVCLCSQEVRAIRRSACVCVSFKCPVRGEMLTPASHCVSRGERTHTHTPPPANATQTPPQHGRRDEQRHAGKKKGVYSGVRLIFSPVCLSISWQLPCWIMTADSDSARPVRLQTPGSDQCLICSSSAERGGVNERCK